MENGLPTLPERWYEKRGGELSEEEEEIKRRGRRGEDGDDDAGDDVGWKTSERRGPNA